ncbi:hypothetical protein BKA70DRAFT_1219515 [Coprinopsis sp. MPI-PUGE-AT-0042]|nr:hypothetical protein BKA70DRAFT_1219515 [Coprinopsis sp. MPI-PUGE-AT-0042]
MKIVSPELLAVSAYLEKVNEFNAIHEFQVPYTVIFPNPSTTEEIYYDEHDRFQSRNTLRSTQLKISWKGSTRDPKVLLGNEATLESDYFSLGCLMAELMLGRPLFLHSERKSYDYPQDTFLMMEHTIEAFPEQIPYSYGRAAKQLFADDGMVLRGPNIHPEVTHYLGTESLKNYSTHAKPGIGFRCHQQLRKYKSKQSFRTHVQKRIAKAESTRLPTGRV